MIIIKTLTKTQTITYMAMMLAMIVVLSVLEGMLPQSAALPPGFRLGLSNIVTMYALFCTGKKTAFTLSIVKSIFVGCTRGVLAGILSFCGGTLSIIVLIVLITLFKDKLSFIILSIFGAIAHNIGQLIAIIILLYSVQMIYYLPILLIAGIIMGAITGTILKVVMPALSKIS